MRACHPSLTNLLKILSLVVALIFLCIYHRKLKLRLFTNFDMVFPFSRFILTFVINLIFANPGRGACGKGLL